MVGLGGSKNTSSSSSSTPAELTAFYNRLDSLSGGAFSRLGQGGSAAEPYRALSADQLRSVGGAGASRELALKRTFDDQNDQIGEDASLTISQKQRAKQLAGNDYSAGVDAVRQSAEAELAGLTAADNAALFNSSLASADSRRADLQTILQAFFGGKASTSSSSGRSFNASLAG